MSDREQRGDKRREEEGSRGTGKRRSKAVLLFRRVLSQYYFISNQ